jgi:NADH-quinone oxidoreductase subunit L
MVPALPLAGFLANGLLRRHLPKTVTAVLGSGVILAAFLISIALFRSLGQSGPQTIDLFPFISVGKLSISFSFLIDPLSVLFLLIITGIGFLIHLYSASYMKEESPEHYARYFSYLNLFVFSMLLLVMGANYVIMFIGWEGVGLCSYLLIGYWFGNHEYNNAAKKAFIMNRIGDLGFLLAVFWMINQFGSVSYAEVFSKAAGSDSLIITGITLLLFTGATGKSAQIPLYTWLPDAMAGPTPVSALIHAATMVTAGIYMIARSHVLFSMSPLTLNIVAVIGLATSLLAASVALYQNDIKKVLAYSTVSQLGLMFLALGVGAYSSGVFHVMTHAFFKALLFLAAGSVIHAMGGEQDITRMGGLRQKIPVTFITFLIGVFAIAGFPFTSGFISKDEILMAVYAHNKVLFGFALIVPLLTMSYMFRLLTLTFFGMFRGTTEQEHHLHESPVAMTFPLILLALLSLVGGAVQFPHLFGGHDYLNEFLRPSVGVSEKLAGDLEQVEWMLFGFTTIAFILIFWFVYRQNRTGRVASTEGGIKKVLAHKWYVDELYDRVVVRPVKWFSSRVLSFVEQDVIDWAVNGVGKVVQAGSRQLRLMQSGQVGSYVLLMVIGAVVFFLIQFLLLKK